MTDIKSGEVAFIIASQEPVFVLEIKQGISVMRYPELSGLVATVRRATEGEQGIRHSVEFFTVEELETLTRRQVRQLQEMEEMEKNWKNQRGKQATPASELSVVN